MYLGIPNIGDDNIISHKIILFISIFYFYFLINSISKIFRKCSIGVKELMGRSSIIAVSGVLGYGLYNDLSSNELLRGYLFNTLKITKNSMSVYRNLLVTFFIMLFIIFIRCAELLISYDDMSCKN
jgi:hypothetical protein